MGDDRPRREPGAAGPATVTRLGPAELGALAFLLLQGFFALAWERLFQPASLETPWFLGSRAAIVVTQVALGVLALSLAARASSWPKRFADGALMIAGVMAAIVALFFLIGPAKLMTGPTDLWPVVLVSAFLLLAPAVLAGTLLGGYLKSLQK